MKLLYVADDAQSLDLVRQELQRGAPHFSLEIVGSCAEARSRLGAPLDFDLVLIDLRLPDGSGLELTTEIREHNIALAIVVLTAAGDEMTAVAALKSGADDYLATDAQCAARLIPTLEGALSRFRAAQERRRRPLRVLYAERNQADIDLTRRHLARFAPHIRLDVVHSGQDVLRRLSEHEGASLPWDVLLLDYQLPGLDALEVLKIVHDERKVDIPIVLVTGQGDELVAARAFNLGAMNYLVKHSSYLYELPATLESASHQAQLLREKTALRRSEASARRRAAEVSALLDISLAITSLDLDASLAEIGRRAKTLFQAGGSCIYLIEPGQNTPRCVLSLEGEGERTSDSLCHLGAGIAGSVAAAGQAEIVTDTTQDARTVCVEGGSRAAHTMMSAPLRERERVIGAISVSRTLPAEPFQSSDLDLLRALASLAAVTITNASLHQQTQARLNELETLYAVSSSLRSAPDWESVLSDLLARALSVLETDAGAVWLKLPDQDALYCFASRGWFQALDTTPMLAGEGIGGTVLASGQTHFSPEFREDPAARAPARYQVPPGWGGVCVPIRTADETLGILFVSVPLPQQVSQEQVHLLESMAQLSGSAIQRLHLWQQVQRQAQLVQQIVDTVPDGVLLIDGQGQILLANPAGRAFLSSLGVADEGRIEQLGDRPLQDFLAPSSRHGRCELTVGERIFEIEAQPVAGAMQSSGWVLIFSDVTEQRARQLYEQAQERLATVGQLAAGIAHDFGNALGAILLYAQSLEQAPGLDDRQRRSIDAIEEQARHAGNLIRQVLDFSRHSVMERAPLDILPLLKEHVKLLEHILPENIRLSLVYGSGEFLVNADPTRLQQALMNLSINARDAMPNGGAMGFEMERLVVTQAEAPPLPDMAPGAWVALTVKDNGMGIAPENLPHIFTPFFTTKEAGRGTGLGLAQVHGIVKQHDGSIGVSSQPGQGSTFTIYLPLHGSAQETARVRSQTPPLAGGREQILVVEDNSAILLAVTDTLESLGYEVTAAGNGVEALAIIERRGAGAFDLVVSDVVMPQMGGVELYRTVRKSYPALKMLLMTGHPRDEPGLGLGDLDGVEWLQKPFEVSTLAQKIRTLLG